MTMLAFALALATASTNPHFGTLYVHVVTPGLQILIDNVPVAKSTPEEGGALIKNVLPGPHRVAIRADDGREAAFNVTIESERQSDITVSPLGFRKLNRAPDTDETSIVHLISIPLDAMIEFNGMTRENHDATELTFDNVPAGKQKLVVTQAGRAIRSEIEIPKATVVTAEVKFKEARVSVTDTRVRPRKLQLSEPNDALRMLNVPPHWKTAIRTALPNTVSIVDAWAATNAVKVRLRVPSDKMVSPLLNSLSSSSSFSRVAYGSYPQRDQGGWVVDFVFYFAS